MTYLHPSDGLDFLMRHVSAPNFAMMREWEGCRAPWRVSVWVPIDFPSCSFKKSPPQSEAR